MSDSKGSSDIADKRQSRSRSRSPQKTTKKDKSRSRSPLKINDQRTSSISQSASQSDAAASRPDVKSSNADEEESDDGWSEERKFIWEYEYIRKKDIQGSRYSGFTVEITSKLQNTMIEIQRLQGILCHLAEDSVQRSDADNKEILSDYDSQPMTIQFTLDSSPKQIVYWPSYRKDANMMLSLFEYEKTVFLDQDERTNQSERQCWRRIHDITVLKPNMHTRIPPIQRSSEKEFLPSFENDLVLLQHIKQCVRQIQAKNPHALMPDVCCIDLDGFFCCRVYGH